MGRSPIEMMVDRACGIEVVDGVVRPIVAAKEMSLDSETKALLKVVDVAKVWLKLRNEGKRNARNEKALADAVAILVSLGW